MTLKILKATLKYFLICISILVIEVLIALYVQDPFVRPFLGDTLVILLLYSFILFWFSVFKLDVSKLKVALCVLLFAFLVEFAQYANVLDILDLRQYKMARIILGTSYDWRDLIAYVAGFLVLRIIDK